MANNGASASTNAAGASSSRPRPPSKKQAIVFDRQVLRDEEWDENHITLAERLTMRGFEPLLPASLKFDFGFLPDALFEDNDDAYINSLKSNPHRAAKELEKLFELGGWVRDRVYLKGRITPEVQVTRAFNTYTKYIESDAGMTGKGAVPMVVVEAVPAGTEPATIEQNARTKLARLANRHREALKAGESVGDAQSQSANKGPNEAEQIPTLYALVASHTILALIAYRPQDEREVTQEDGTVVREAASARSLAFFNMARKGYDVWNGLALAIIACHLRNVQLGLVAKPVE